MKKILFGITCLFASMVVMPNVYAATEVTSAGTLATAISELHGQDGTVKITSGFTADEMITIQDVQGSITIDLNGQKIDRNGGTTVFDIKKSNVTFKDSTGKGSIEHTGNGGAIYADSNSTVTIESGTYKGGIMAWGDKATINIKGGTIEATGFAVAGNGKYTTNSTITISGGTLTSTGTAAIYQPQSGTLTVTNGNITGKVGIVARQGNVKVTGGKITANGDAGTKDRVGDAKTAEGGYVEVPLGVAVVVDNTESAYPNTAKVEITGGTFDTTDTPVASFGKIASDIVVKGGKFNKKVETMYVAEGLTQTASGNVIAETEDENALDNVPKTGSSLPIALIGLLGLATLAGAYSLKLAYARK